MLFFEKKIIGSIAAGTIKPSAVNLAPSDFSDNELGQMLAVSRRMEADGIEIDAESLYLETASDDFGFYSARHFREWSETSVAATILAVEKIKSAALKKYLTNELSRIAVESDKTGAEILTSLKRIVSYSEIYQRAGENNFKFLSELKDKVAAVYTDLHNGVSYAVPTYSTQRDELLLDGYSKGDLHIIVGQTGAGKSSLALCDVKAQAENGHVAGFLTREMSEVQNVMRLQANDAGVPRWKIRKNMWDSTYEALMTNLETFSRLPIAFDAVTEDVRDLRPQAMATVEKYGMEILYVDYLQLMSNADNNATRANEVQSISRELKKLAMDLQIPVVALCQFNNGVANASLFEVMNYIRESGSIKQDASTIQYVQVEQTEEQKDIKEAKVTVLKNRDGAPFKSVDLRFVGAEFRFEEI